MAATKLTIATTDDGFSALYLNGRYYSEPDDDENEWYFLIGREFPSKDYSDIENISVDLESFGYDFPILLSELDSVKK
ncbi:hypothetical protein [Empedobacter falsenii]|uniref:hypothetical protein n=1 Tax=Empedobacter falsenii TaxID=343874 RepID=UPI003A81361F